MNINPYKISEKTFQKAIDKTQLMCYTIYTARETGGKSK